MREEHRRPLRFLPHKGRSLDQECPQIGHEIHVQRGHESADPETQKMRSGTDLIALSPAEQYLPQVG